MKKFFIKTIATVISVVFILSVFTVTCFAADRGVIILSARTLKTGDSITVTVKYSSSENLKNIEGTLSFDSTLLEYVEGGVSAEDNTVTIKEDFTGNVSQQFYAVKFKAISPGNAAFSFSLQGTKVNGTRATVAQGATAKITGSPIEPTNNENPIPVSNDFTVEDKSVNYHIINDVEQIPLIPNFKRSVTSLDGQKYQTITDKFNEYKLFYMQSEDNTKTKWFYLKDKELLPLNYITFNNEIYIVENSVNDNSVPEGNWKASSYILSSSGETVDCYESTKTILADFRIFQCYYDGERGYYRYDTKTSVLQRDPEFILVSKAPESETGNTNGVFKYFNSMPYYGKLLITLSMVEFIAIIALISLIIIRKKKIRAEEEIEDI